MFNERTYKQPAERSNRFPIISLMPIPCYLIFVKVQFADYLNEWMFYGIIVYADFRELILWLLADKLGDYERGGDSVNRGILFIIWKMDYFLQYLFRNQINKLRSLEKFVSPWSLLKRHIFKNLFEKYLFNIW